MDTDGIAVTKDREFYRARRQGALLGIGIWVAWALTMVISIHTQISSDETNRFYSSLIFSWLIYGPFLVFMFVGRLIISTDSDVSRRQTEKNNLAISLASFLGWALLVEVLVIANIEIYAILILAGGWMIALVPLTIYNKSWRF